MFDRATIELVAALGDPATRVTAAATLASRVGADALLLFVEDVGVDALLPAPGVRQTLPGGLTWREFLDRCRTAGFHRGELAYPTAEERASAIACTGHGIAMVFLGGRSEAEAIEPFCSLLPLLGAALRAEFAAVAASGELAVAREEARHAALLARSLDSAREALERQTKSLRDAHARAEEAMRVKDEFLAMLGHELRNPLSPITTVLQILRQKGNHSREQEILERQVGHLTRLVDDLLDVSRIARGKVELRRNRIELAAVVARAVEMAGPLIAQKRQRLTVDVPSSGMLVHADSDRLAQVFSNLLTNASKYSDVETEVRITAEEASGTVVVRVRDQGIGIVPTMLDAVFDHFTQQQQSIDRAQGGLGLGLAIVRNLVTLHGGTVRALSDGLNRGSEFVVELPLVQAEPAMATRPTTAARSARPPRAPGGVERVLIVDDNADGAEMLGLALAGLGYVVRTACDGPSALAAAKEFGPEVAVLDIGLPIMDGYELGRRLSQADLQPRPRLVALTGYGQASDKARTREAGFQAHLVKPIDLGDLLRLLNDLGPTPP